LYNCAELCSLHKEKALDIDWNLVAKVAGGGYGVTFLVLAILAVCAWLTGVVIQRTTRNEEEEDGSKRG
jgi:hypothetical protein